MIRWRRWKWQNKIKEVLDHPCLKTNIWGRWTTLLRVCFSFWTSSESAFNGLVVGFDPSTIIDQAACQILSKPNFCPVTLLSLDPVIHSFDFYSQETADTFQKMAALAGASFGEEMFKLDQWIVMTSENNNNNTIVTYCLLCFNCYRCPTESFQLERSQMIFASATCRQQKSLWLIMDRIFRPVAFNLVKSCGTRSTSHQRNKRPTKITRSWPRNGWKKNAHSPSVVQCLRLLFPVSPFISDDWVRIGSSRSSILQLKPRSFKRLSSLKAMSDHSGLESLVTILVALVCTRIWFNSASSCAMLGWAKLWTFLFG